MNRLCSTVSGALSKGKVWYKLLTIPLKLFGSLSSCTILQKHEGMQLLLSGAGTYGSLAKSSQDKLGVLFKLQIADLI